ncbi:MAG: hypothetical protein RL885_15830 [Planctomycetota bacterium]
MNLPVSRWLLRHLPLVFSICLLSSSALAQAPAPSEADAEIIRAMDKAVYSQVRSGLKDLTLRFRNPDWQDDPLFRNLDVLFYWKEPRQKRFAIEGLPRAYKSLEARRVQSFQFMIELLVHLPYEDNLERTPMSVVRDAQGNPKQPIEVERRFPEGHPVLKQVYTLDERFLPIKVTTYQREAAFTITREQQFEKREDGSYLITRMINRAPGYEETIDIEYVTRKDIDLTSKITLRYPPSEDAMKAGAEDTVKVYDIEIVAVNSGLSDELFDSEK